MLRPSGVIAFLSLSLFLWGSTDSQAQSTAPPSITSGVYLEAGTPINLRLARQITSKKSKAGDLILFQVCGDVTVGSLVVIPTGTIALGHIAHSQPSGMLGRGGKIAVELDRVATLTGEQVPLGGTEEKEGQFEMGGLGTATLLVLPLLPFQHGDQADLPSGTIVTAFVKSQVPIDQARLSAENQAFEAHLKSLASGVPEKAVVSIYRLRSPASSETRQITRVIRLDAKDLVHIAPDRFVTILLEPGKHKFTSGESELELRVETGAEYYVKVSDEVEQGRSDTGVRPVLQAVGSTKAEPEMYLLTMSSSHDIKDHAVVVLDLKNNLCSGNVRHRAL